MIPEKAPATEPKVLPVDEMLATLRRYAEGLRTFEANAKERAANWRKVPVEVHPAAEEHAQQHDRMAAKNAHDAAALEQAIATFEVMSHPNFYGIDTFGTRSSVGAVVPGHGMTWWHADTIVEAILKVHEVLYPKTTKTEDTPHGE